MERCQEGKTEVEYLKYLFREQFSGGARYGPEIALRAKEPALKRAVYKRQRQEKEKAGKGKMAA
jgi:hypothetical protein